MSAAKDGSVQRVRVLLQDGADVDYMDTSNDTALHKACRYGRNDVVKLLLDAGSDVNSAKRESSGVTPLQLATHQGHLDVFLTLMSYPGINVNLADKTYTTPPIFMAAENRRLTSAERLAIVQALIFAGARTRCGSLDSPDTSSKETDRFPKALKGFPPGRLVGKSGGVELIRWVLMTSQDPAILRWLLENGHTDDVDLNKLLEIAAWTHHKACSEILVEFGADPKAGDPPMLAVAMMHSNQKMVKLLRSLIAGNSEAAERGAGVSQQEKLPDDARSGEAQVDRAEAEPPQQMEFDEREC